MTVDLTPQQVAERLAADAPPLLLDVREDWERRTASIPGSQHIPLAQVPSRVEELPTDRDIVVYCHHGARSSSAVQWLHDNGRPRATNLAGGIDAWSVQIDDSVPRYH